MIARLLLNLTFDVAAAGGIVLLSPRLRAMIATPETRGEVLALAAVLILALALLELYFRCRFLPAWQRFLMRRVHAKLAIFEREALCDGDIPRIRHIRALQQCRDLDEAERVMAGQT